MPSEEDDNCSQEEQTNFLRRIGCPLRSWSVGLRTRSVIRHLQPGDSIEGFVTLSFKKEAIVKDVLVAINGAAYGRLGKRIEFFKVPGVVVISQDMRAYPFRTARKVREVAVRIPDGSIRLPLRLSPLLPAKLPASMESSSLSVKYTATLTFQFLDGGKRWRPVCLSVPVYFPGYSRCNDNPYEPPFKEAFGYVPFENGRRLVARLSLTKTLFIPGELMWVTLLLSSTPGPLRINECKVTLDQITREDVRYCLLGWKKLKTMRAVASLSEDCRLLRLNSPWNMALPIPTGLLPTFEHSYREIAQISYVLRAYIRYADVKKLSVEIEVEIARPDTDENDGLREAKGLLPG